MRRIICLMALAPLPALASPPAAADMCGEVPPPPEPWTSWGQSGAAIAGGEVLTAPRLILGKPLVATLRPQVQVQYPVTQPKASLPKGAGGLFTLALKEPARVGIAISHPAWIDIITDNVAMASADERQGPECSGIAKIMWFDLPRGLHIIALSGAISREIRIMAADASANRRPWRE